MFCESTHRTSLYLDIGAAETPERGRDLCVDQDLMKRKRKIPIGSSIPSPTAAYRFFSPPLKEMLLAPF